MLRSTWIVKILVLATLLWLARGGYAQQQDSVAMQVNVEQVTVTHNKQLISTPNREGNISLNMDALITMPHLAGAADVMRFLQFTPGVTATADGDSAIYVRGGDSGQNRTLLNNAPIYSPAHLLGFFSVFNSGHLGGVTLLKSNIPVQYGSSLSSITEVRSKMYIPKRVSGEGNIGLIESDIALEIPLHKRWGMHLSARHSYSSWLVAIINNDSRALKYEFGDFGLTLVGDLGKVGKLIFNSHFNHDFAKMHYVLYDSNGALKWWNSASSLILKTRLSDRVTMESTLYASIYDNKLAAELTNNPIDALSSLSDYGARVVTTAAWDKVHLVGGADYSFRRIMPQVMLSALAPVKGGGAEHREIQLTHESSLFASAIYRPHRVVELDLGVRLSLYNIGRTTLFNPEPRVMLSLPITADCSVWASYNMSVQYLQLVPQSNGSFATDFYTSSTEKNPPQRAHNFSLGYRDAALSGSLRWSVEAFYRRMFNVIEFDTRLNTMMSGDYSHDDFLYSGDGESYGVEFMLAYHHKKFNLQANYTLARSLRRFDEINEGLAFPAKSDRRHNLSFVASYNPSKRWSLAATFIYATGAAYTRPTAIFMTNGSILKEFGPYNGARLPDLHRLDISATYWFSHRGFERSGINLSIYNTYARKNPLYISWAVHRDDNDESLMRVSERLHALYTLLPSISWIYKF